MRGLVLLLATAAIPCLAQLDSNTLTVTATRTVALQPDQVVLSVVVGSGPNATLDQIVAALPGTGISATDLVGVTASQPGTIFGPAPLELSWTFPMTAPLAKIKDAIAQLSALALSIGRNQTGLSLSFSVHGVQPSSQVQQAQKCPTTVLIADANAQAQRLADAAQVNLGPILDVSESSVAQGAALLGVLSNVALFNGLASISPYVPIAPSYMSCSTTVKFRSLF
jgi:uncharacterized protein YggE